VLALVGIGHGVALVPQLGLVDPAPGVRLTRLAMHRTTLAAYRRGAGGHPAIAAFVRAVREVHLPPIRALD
jgi:DNA-binding transcriptional LysR family regulator